MRFLTVLSLFFLLTFPALAERAAPVPQETAKIETYLRGISTLKARFVQTDNYGQQTAGDFYLSRPGKMRFQYDAPLTDFIVALGPFISVPIMGDTVPSAKSSLSFLPSGVAPVIPL